MKFLANTVHIQVLLSIMEVLWKYYWLTKRMKLDKNCNVWLYVSHMQPFIVAVN